MISKVLESQDLFQRQKKSWGAKISLGFPIFLKSSGRVTASTIGIPRRLLATREIRNDKPPPSRPLIVKALVFTCSARALN